MADRGLVTALNGKPMSRLLTTVQLGDCRKLFRGRAASRGVTPTVTKLMTHCGSYWKPTRRCRSCMSPLGISPLEKV
jgi:hypothetical protein